MNSKWWLVVSLRFGDMRERGGGREGWTDCAHGEIVVWWTHAKWEDSNGI